MNLNPLPTKSVDGVLKTFNKAINDLRSIEAFNSDKYVKNRQKIEDLSTANKALLQETDRASAIAAKLEKLIS